MNLSSSLISRRLAQAGPTAFSAYCIVAAFGTYFCMYAFRKPFTAGTFEDTLWMGLGYKTVLVAAQVTGYTISKFLGIKFVSEMPARLRAVAILGLIGVAEAALLLFALTPPPYNFIWLFVNGLPLGMVFGLVIAFLEGRKLTEALAAGLCASFIMASGVVKSVGRTLIQDWGVSEYWMPFVTGLLFVVPLFVAVWMLAHIPPPTEDDVERRSKRETMDADARLLFFKRHALGLVGLLVIYVLLTIGRSIRDDFAVEIWRDLGVSKKPEVFVQSESWVMVGVVVINGLVMLILDNRKAFFASLGLLCLGFAIVLASVIGQSSGQMSPMFFMISLGLGMYIPYVAFHTTVFERLIAAFREAGTIGYLLYLADAIGYLGYVGVMVFRNTVSGEVDFLKLLIWVSLTIAIVSTALSILLGAHYFRTIPFEKQTSVSSEATL